MPGGPFPSNMKAVLFDVDGTLVDTLPALIKGLGDAYERFNGWRPSDREIEALIGMPLREQLALFRDEAPGDDELRKMMAFTIDRFEENKDLERFFEPAIQMLRLCIDYGLKTALVTSKSDVELNLFLKRFEEGRRVHTAVCASDVANPKPAPDSALLACERLGVKPEEAIFIGDSVYDMRCGKSAAMPVIAVTYGSGTREALSAEEPDLLLNTPDELLEWAENTILRTPCLEKR
jgi:pyrophosphatase PpaX